MMGPPPEVVDHDPALRKSRLPVFSHTATQGIRVRVLAQPVLAMRLCAG